MVAGEGRRIVRQEDYCEGDTEGIWVYCFTMRRVVGGEACWSISWQDYHNEALMIDWEKHHRFMPRPGWCGPTTVWMVLSACGIKRPIGDIARHIWKKWYGTPPQLMAAYLAKFFDDVWYHDESTISYIRSHIDRGYIVIVNWHDETEGHYSIVSGYTKDRLQMVDSSREREWTYSIKNKNFFDSWHDFMATDNRQPIYNLLIAIDPKSVKVI